MDVVDRQVQVVVPKGAPPKSPGQKEDERRQEARQVCRAKWHEELSEVLAGLPVLCHDDGWNGKIWNVLGEGWRCDDALGGEWFPRLSLVCARAVSPRM